MPHETPRTTNAAQGYRSRFASISHITDPMTDHFAVANRVIYDLATALEDVQGQLEDALDAIKDLAERLEELEKRTPDDFGGKQITSGEGEPY